MEIKKTSEVKNAGLSMLIYGESGVGKTSLASTLSGKTLIISAEGGLLSLKNSEIDYVEVKGANATEKYNSLVAIMLEVYNGVEYSNIFIDSLTEISQIIVDHNFLLINNDSSKGLRAFGEANKQMKSFIKFCRDTPNYNFIITALAQTDKDEFNRRYKLPDLIGKLAQQVSQYYDEVFYLHKSEEEKEDGSKKRILYTDLQQSVSKDRSGNLLPAIEEPNLENIIKEIRKWENL